VTPLVDFSLQCPNYRRLFVYIYHGVEEITRLGQRGLSRLAIGA
jgi:hypothetical protein